MTDTAIVVIVESITQDVEITGPDPIVVEVGGVGPRGPSGADGAQGPVGPQGPTGAPGTGGSTIAYHFAASTVWTIPHNLNRYPPLWTQDSAGTEIVGDVQYVDNNTITVTWTFPQGGTAYLDA